MKSLLPAALVAVVCITSPAAAQTNEAAAIDQTLACREIEDDMERLQCLDGAAETLAVTRIIREEAVAAKKQEERDGFGLNKKSKTKEERTASSQAPATPAVTETEEEFGSERLADVRKEREDRKLKSISAKIAEVRVNPFGKVTVTLENGQVWRQLNSEGRILKLREGRLYNATVKRSLFGNYMLTIKELKRTIRVRRVQ